MNLKSLLPVLLMKARRLFSPLILPFFLLALVSTSSLEARYKKKQPTKLPYEIVAEAETNVWESYYSLDFSGVTKNFSIMLTQLFGVKNEADAELIANKFIPAFVVFAKIPNNINTPVYRALVLPQLAEAYQTLKNITRAHWDAEKVARLDLDWWIARRRIRANDPVNVAKLIEELYSELHPQNHGYHFAEAAYFRSMAARYRDESQLAWGGMTEERWKYVQKLLEMSYKELSLGIEPENAK
jgi:hypothetical protein